MRFSVPAVYTGEQSQLAGLSESHDILPLGSEPTRRNIEDLFSMLEQHKEELDIAFYSVSPSTFDEVFLEVIEKYHVGEEEVPLREKRWWMTARRLM